MLQGFLLRCIVLSLAQAQAPAAPSTTTTVPSSVPEFWTKYGGAILLLLVAGLLSALLFPLVKHGCVRLWEWLVAVRHGQVRGSASATSRRWPRSTGASS